MAKTKVPANDEMREYEKLFRADPIHNAIRDLEHITMIKEVTKLVFAVNMPESTREIAWKFCKAIANCAHAPVSSAEYKRMQKFVGEAALTDVLLEALDGYFPGPANKYKFDTVGYSYALALISQTQYRRSDCLAFIDKLTNYFVSTKYDWYTVALRNMKVLVKDYPDLAPFKTALESI